MQLLTVPLFDELTNMVNEANLQVLQWKDLPLNVLLHRPQDKAWSALECIAHLNLYGDFYLPEFEKRILNATCKMNTNTFHPGIMGNYFASLMKPKNGHVKKMQAPKDKVAIAATLSTSTLDTFLAQQEKLLKLLSLARQVNINKTRVSISLTKFISLKLGDGLRFFIYHIDRHIQQASKAILATNYVS